MLHDAYDGFSDQPVAGATVLASGSFAATCWFVDTTAQAWAGAGPCRSGSVAWALAGKCSLREQLVYLAPDVAAALGSPYWTMSRLWFQDRPYPAGRQTLNEVKVPSPTEGENVSASRGPSFTISCTAGDPVYGFAASDSVDVWISGEQNTPSPTDVAGVLPEQHQATLLLEAYQMARPLDYVGGMMQCNLNFQLALP